MTYYNCVKFRCGSVFSFGVSKGPPKALTFQKTPWVLRVKQQILDVKYTKSLPKNASFFYSLPNFREYRMDYGPKKLENFLLCYSLFFF